MRTIKTALGALIVIGSVISSEDVRAQNYGGIANVTAAFPLQTYSTPVENQKPQPGKLLTKTEFGEVRDVLILSVFGFGGNGYLEIETKSGDHWIRRTDVTPERPKLVDQAIADSNGKFTCPPGKTRVVVGESPNERSGVARGLGGASILCK